MDRQIYQFQMTSTSNGIRIHSLLLDHVIACKMIGLFFLFYFQHNVLYILKE